MTVWLAAIAAAAGASDAQQVVLQTNATAANGVVSQSDIVVADLEERAFSAPLFSVASHGEEVVDRVFTGGALIWLTNPRDRVRGYELVELPLTGRGGEVVRYELAQPGIALAAAPDAPAPQLAVALGDDESSTLLVFTRDANGRYLASSPRDYRLRGRIVDLAWLPEPGLWAALCASPVAAAVELFGPHGRERVPIDAGPAEPQRLACVGGSVLVVSSSYARLRPDGGMVTSIRVAHPPKRRGAPPIELAGSLVSGAGAVYAVDENRVWIATETRGTASAVASLIVCGEELSLETMLSLPSATDSYRVAQGLDKSFLFACGGVLQACTLDGVVLGTRKFDAPVSALHRRGDLAIVGEGNRVHGVSLESLESDRTIHLYSGRVAAVGRLAGDLPALGDADGDNIFDPIDPNPDERLPGLVVPRTVRLRRAGPASAVRAIPLELSTALKGFAYRLDAPSDSGILLEPRSGALPGTLTIALDPVHWLNHREASGRIPVRVAMVREGSTAPLSSAHINLLVERGSEVPGRILVVPSNQDDAMVGFIGLLREPPQFYSVTVDRKPSANALADYDGVAIALDAVLAGRIPRVALERYTSSGGALMLVGSPELVDRIADVREWLHPFRIDVRSAAGSSRAVRGECDWCDVWSNAGLRSGFLASVEPPGRAVFMPGRAVREGPMTRSPLGLGRVVFIGSESLLEAAPDLAPVREAVLDAVRWLMRTRTEVLDQDADGLADDVEDANGNGLVDEGETDFTRADSDGDLVVDGLEDANGNGRVDEGETDPRNPDTDADRVADGADAGPLPRPAPDEAPGLVH